MTSIKFYVYKEPPYYVAQCINVDVSSFGTSIEEAIMNLKEAVALLREEPSGPIAYNSTDELVPKRLSSREVVRILTENGFAFVSQKGSHKKYRNLNGRVVIVPADRNEIPVGTMSSIVRQSGLDSALFR